MARRRVNRRRGRRSRRRGFSTWSLGKKIGAVLGGTLVMVIIAGIGIVASKLSKIEYIELDPEALNVTQTVTEEERQRGIGYLNVALFGLDSREGAFEGDVRSDTIMVASLNRETMEVKITSIYRDTLMELHDGDVYKANSAYFFGGPQEAVAMLNRNLDLDIEKYVTVNFDAMIDVIDAVGGIEIDVQEEEISYICGYVTEMMNVTGRVSAGVTEPGPQILNGMQATAYARIRATVGDDFRRTERQREVVAKIVEKLQSASLAQINEIIDVVFPQVATNFTMAEILDYAKDVFDYRLGEMGGFPYEHTTDTLSGLGSVVIPTTMESNVTQLHQFFFGSEEGYVPSTSIEEIDYKITMKSSQRDTGSGIYTGETADAYAGSVTGEMTDDYYDTGTTESTGDGTGTGIDTETEDQTVTEGEVGTTGETTAGTTG